MVCFTELCPRFSGDNFLHRSFAGFLRNYYPSAQINRRRVGWSDDSESANQRVPGRFMGGIRGTVYPRKLLHFENLVLPLLSFFFFVSLSDHSYSHGRQITITVSQKSAFEWRNGWKFYGRALPFIHPPFYRAVPPSVLNIRLPQSVFS